MGISVIKVQNYLNFIESLNVAKYYYVKDHFFLT